MSQLPPKRHKFDLHSPWLPPHPRFCTHFHRQAMAWWTCPLQQPALMWKTLPGAQCYRGIVVTQFSDAHDCPTSSKITREAVNTGKHCTLFGRSLSLSVLHALEPEVVPGVEQNTP